ncbi:MAG: hypothetical protein ABI700_00970 [Chloroflexota bacterium]
MILFFEDSEPEPSTLYDEFDYPDAETICDLLDWHPYDTRPINIPLPTRPAFVPSYQALLEQLFNDVPEETVGLARTEYGLPLPGTHVTGIQEDGSRIEWIFTDDLITRHYTWPAQYGGNLETTVYAPDGTHLDDLIDGSSLYPSSPTQDQNHAIEPTPF